MPYLLAGLQIYQESGGMAYLSYYSSFLLAKKKIWCEALAQI